MPVERDEPVRADRLGERQLGEVLVDGLTPAAAAASTYRPGTWFVDVPREDVADARLTRLVPVRAGDDAAVDDAAHAGHLDEAVVVHHVARRRPHDREHLARLDRLSRGRRDVRIDVADRDGDALAAGRSRPRPRP